MDDTAGRMTGLTVQGPACGWASVPPGTEPLAGARGSGWAWRPERQPGFRPLGVGVGIGIGIDLPPSIPGLFRSAELLRGGGKGMKGSIRFFSPFLRAPVRDRLRADFGEASHGATKTRRGCREPGGAVARSRAPVDDHPQLRGVARCGVRREASAPRRFGAERDVWRNPRAGACPSSSIASGLPGGPAWAKAVSTLRSATAVHRGAGPDRWREAPAELPCRRPTPGIPLGVGIGIGIDLPPSIPALFRSAELLRGGGKGAKVVDPVLLSVSPCPCERSPQG